MTSIRACSLFFSPLLSFFIFLTFYNNTIILVSKTLLKTIVVDALGFLCKTTCIKGILLYLQTTQNQQKKRKREKKTEKGK